MIYVNSWRLHGGLHANSCCNRQLLFKDYGNVGGFLHMEVSAAVHIQMVFLCLSESSQESKEMTMMRMMKPGNKHLRSV